MHTWGRFVCRGNTAVSKEFKTIEEQMEILRSRGLLIPDEDQAGEFLLHNNYYRISGYSLTLRKNDRFSEGTTFQNIIDIYNFDHQLRHILLTYIETIEVSFKSVYAYEFTKIYGPAGYLNGSNFTNAGQYSSTLKKTEKQKQLRLPHEAYLKHFVNDVKEPIPLWAYVDLMTIADISLLYSISREEVQYPIAARYHLKSNKGRKILGQFMHSMTILRNLCAHGSRLYNRLFEQKPSLNRKELNLLIRKENGTVDNAHLYGFVMIMKRLLPADDFVTLKSDIMLLTERYPFVHMKYYGFRDDWKNVL